MRFATLVVSFCLVASACNDEPEPVRGTVNAASATASIATLQDVVVAMNASDASGAAGAVMALAAVGQSLVIPTASPRTIELPSRMPRPAAQSLTGTVMCTGATCTYEKYGDDNFYVDGYLTVLPERVMFDLKFHVVDPDLTLDWHIYGDLTVTKTLIDGDVHVDGVAKSTAGDDDFEIAWKIDVAFEQIVLDETGCAIGGALAAEVLYAVEGNGYHAAARVRFGPACGEWGP